MKRILFLIFILGSTSAFAQTDSLRLSLDQAIEQGLKNRFDVKANAYNVDLANNDVEARKNSWLPEINGSGVIRQNIQIQQAYIPGGFAGLKEPMLVKFGASNIAAFGLDLSQVVYNPSIKKDIQIAQTQTEIQKEKLKADENAIRERITQAYLNVQLRQLQYNIIAQNQTRFAEYLSVAEGKFKNGSLIENEVLKARLDFENAKIETQKAKQNVEMALLMLAYQMNYTGKQPIALTESLQSMNIASQANSMEQILQNRADFKLLNLQKTAQTLMIEKANNATIPTAAFFGNYSGQFTSMKWDIGQSKWWSPYSYVGLKLNVPISAYYKDKTQINGIRLKQSQLDLQMEQRKSDINYQWQSAQMELNNALKNKQQAEDNYKLSQTIYATQKAQYALGSLQYSNLLDTEKALSMAEQNYLKSVFDFMVAQINYKKAVGEF